MRINIATHIASILCADPEIVKVVGTNMYPVATKIEKAFPLIVYERDSAVSRYDKGGAVLSEVSATVFAITEDYTSGVELSEMIISALDRKMAQYPGYDVIDALHIGSNEGYQDGAFIQQVQFSFIIKPKS